VPTCGRGTLESDTIFGWKAGIKSG
jgi:hypothetical protein